MKNALVAVVVVGILGAMGWGLFKPRYPTPMPFEDALGETHAFPEYQTQGIPVVVTLFSEQDSFSPRTLDLLKALREKYPVERLAIVAFHLKAADPAALLQYGRSKGYDFTLVPIQKTPALGIDLSQTMGMSYAGDVAVISPKGKIQTVIACKDLSQAEFEEKVRKAVKKVAGE